MGFLKVCLCVCVSEVGTILMFKPQTISFRNYVSFQRYTGWAATSYENYNYIYIYRAHDSTYRLINNTRETHQFSVNFYGLF